MAKMYYTLPFSFDETIYNSVRYAVDGYDFINTVYLNRSDQQLYIDIFDIIRGEYLLQGVKCIPELPLDSERNYVKSNNNKYQFHFIRKDNKRAKENITPETLGLYDLNMVVFE